MEYCEYSIEEYDDYSCRGPSHMRMRPLDPLLQYNDEEFRDRFRMSARCAIKLYDILSDSLKFQTGRQDALSPICEIEQVLLDATSGKIYHIPPAVLTLIQPDLNIDDPNMQLGMLKSLVKQKSDMHPWSLLHFSGAPKL